MPPTQLTPTQLTPTQHAVLAYALEHAATLQPFVLGEVP